MTTTQGRDGGDPSEERIVAVGRIGKAIGLKGEAFVEPWTDAPDERFVPGTVLTPDPRGPGPLTVEAVRDHSGKLVVRFVGVPDRTAVEALRGLVLTMPAARRPSLDDPDEFYDTDLIGLQVATLDGRELGPVTEVLHSAGGSLLAVDVDGREVLVPFQAAIVPVVDIAGGRIGIDPPAGLLEL